jgi:hypothetical protein
MLASYSHKTYYARKSKMHLVLSAEMPCRTLCKAFLVKSIPKNIPKTRKWPNKKLLAG